MGLCWIQGSIALTQTQQDLPCLLYERLYTHCANHYGFISAAEHPECKTILKFFNTCIQQHTFHGYMKKYNPEFYATYDASRSKVNFGDLIDNHTLWSVNNQIQSIYHSHQLIIVIYKSYIKYKHYKSRVFFDRLIHVLTNHFPSSY